MEQEKLEEKARKLFEQQGFNVEKQGETFQALNDGVEKSFRCYSSESYSLEEVEAAEGVDIVFVDGPLADAEPGCELSVLREEDRETVEMPSYELIGDIAVVNELVGFSEDEAVERITSQHPRVKTVLLKEEPLQGEFRVGGYRKLYGSETETVHTEFGCRFRVDPTEVYYSERFSTERDRVVSQIEDGERVLVMFAGVGPFAVMAARNANPSKVVAVEKNPKAAEFLRENVELNSVGDIVEVHKGDVRDVLPGLEEEFDRIIMPLPGNAKNFLQLADSKTVPEGIIHFYTFAVSPDKAGEKIPEELQERFTVIEAVRCGDRSPGESRYCLDMQHTA